jgi:hypothetical protein
MNARLILAGRDPLAVDACASLLCGHDPLRIPHLVLLHNDSLGCSDPRLIRVDGIKVGNEKQRYQTSDSGRQSTYSDFSAPSFSVESCYVSGDQLFLELVVDDEVAKVEATVDGIALGQIRLGGFQQFYFDLHGLAVDENSEIVVYAHDRYLNYKSRSVHIRPTPVLVEDLQATSRAPASVCLSWRLRDLDDELAGLDVERADAATGPYVRRTRAQLVPEPWMSYIDTPVETGKSYWYRLALTSSDGSTGLVGPVQVEVPGTDHDDATYLTAFAPAGGGDVEVRYRIGDPSASVSLQVFDVRGRLIRTLDAGIRGPGEHVRFWDRHDAAGLRQAWGVYLVRLSAGQVTAVQKFVLTHD